MAGLALPRLLMRIGIVLATVLILVGTLSFWLLRTESGLHFVLARAIGATDGKLMIDKSGGSLAGRATLEGLRYEDAAAGIDVHARHVTIALAPLELLSLRLHVSRLQLDGLVVALSSAPAQPAQQKSSALSLAAPLDVILDQLVVTQATVTRDAQPLFAIDTLDMVGRWTRDGVALTSLALRSPDGEVELHGAVSALAGYPGEGELHFHWNIGGVRYVGALIAHGDGKQAQLDLALSEPMVATLATSLTPSREFPWTANLKVPRFDPKRVQKDSGLASLALDLTGSGDRTHGGVHGDVTINDHRVQLEPLRFTLDGPRLTIDALTLKSPQATGELHASGKVQLDAKPMSANLALDWSDVELPADLAGQVLSTHGKIAASGSTQKFHADGTLSIGPPGNPADIALALDGTPDTIVLKQLALQQPRGGLDAQGTLTLKPAFGWQLSAKANRFDPGAFAAAWPGALNFELVTAGTLTDKGPDATITLDQLRGTLRKRAVSGAANLRIKPDYIVEGTLNLASGNSRIDVSGRGGNQTDATIKFAIASLDDWLPNAAGRLDGQFRVQGAWPKLGFSGHAHGAKITSGGTQIGSLDLTADFASLQPPQGTLHLKAAQLSRGNLAFDTLNLDASGNRQAHQLNLDAHGTPLDFKLALSGSASDDGRWNGTLKMLAVAVRNAPPLALEHAAPLAWDGKRWSIGETCLNGNGPRLCVAGNGSADGALAAQYRIDQVPLALIAQLVSPDAPFAFAGSIAGAGDITRAANGAWMGGATLHSDHGNIASSDHPQQPLLTYSSLAFDANLSPHSTHATLQAALDHDGKLDGAVTLSGAPGATQALSGHINLDLQNLAFVELLTPDVANTKGRLTANYTIAGTPAAPQLNGALTLKDFATELPSAGLKLHDGQIVVRATDADHFTLAGTLKSGDGSVTVSGSGGIGTTAPFTASIKGENFLAADIPAAHVVISPDLRIERSAANISVSGSIAIPKANVDLAKLPGGGVNKRSPDVVVTDAEQPAPGKPLPVIVAVMVNLGDDVKLAGLGLDGSIAGQLRVDQRPGRLATGTGTLNVTGTYRAYGQNLRIESGHLLFAGTALDNPGLDIRAVRNISGPSQGQFDDSITAGLQIRGTALVPILTVFSNPSMEQSESLSYLVTGKPLSGLNSGEGDMLGTAARALGSASGDLLAKGIGARTGLDTGVSNSSALGGAAFTVGKYLSPKLYLSYGVGLFTPGEVVSLKYLFNKHWNFEAQNATTGNRAGINYRIER
ncbi:MAG: translocation/assembly module TamB domain-containing protein, partial [Dokdonella sp.]